MTDTAKQSERLTKREMQCLGEIAEYNSRGHGYPPYWMIGTRLKLEKKGFVEARGPNARGHGNVYGLTDAGRAALKEDQS